MIDWNKPIETVDGRKARVVERLFKNLWYIVYTAPDPESCGSKPDVFLVDNAGVRCDDRAIYSTRQEPFIRNARVKREGWSRMFRDRGKLIVDCDVVYSTKESAEAACQRHGGIAAFIAWESEL